MFENDIDPLELGETADGERIYLDEAARRVHMQVIGATGTGKTKFLEHCIRENCPNRP